MGEARQGGTKAMMKNSRTCGIGLTTREPRLKMSTRVNILQRTFLSEISSFLNIRIYEEERRQLYQIAISSQLCSNYSHLALHPYLTPSPNFFALPTDSPEAQQGYPAGLMGRHIHVLPNAKSWGPVQVHGSCGCNCNPGPTIRFA